ncbi:MAG: hypothetical protein JNM93_11600 [Bacteriovoracaceae bacterium]|nr:hypothetical protein [Bacteriovoracaceae bacterium]
MAKAIGENNIPILLAEEGTVRALRRDFTPVLVNEFDFIITLLWLWIGREKRKDATTIK